MSTSDALQNIYDKVNIAPSSDSALANAVNMANPTDVQNAFSPRCLGDTTKNKKNKSLPIQV
jgi:hypothetical protein